MIILKDDIERYDKTAKKIIEEGFIIYPYKKALFQAIIHRVHNEMENEEISFEELKKIPSERVDGKLGSSGK